MLGAWFPAIGVGGPNLVHRPGWDPVPLLVIGLVVVLMRAAGVRLEARTLLLALLLGLAVDLVTDAARISLLLSIAPIVVTLAIVALRRNPSG